MYEKNRPTEYDKGVAKLEAYLEAHNNRQAAGQIDLNPGEVVRGGLGKLRQIGAVGLTIASLAALGYWVDTQMVEHSSVRNYRRALEHRSTPPEPAAPRPDSSAPTFTIPGQPRAVK